jgi:hypothetical protein
VLPGGASAAPVAGTNVLYTSDADFDKGTLVNVNHDAPNNSQLQVNQKASTFPFIWVSLSQRCTIAKINTLTGAIQGEYRTISDDAACYQSSRTTVALDGSVWVGHRGPGGVTHVGLVELNQCVDRNGNGTIETSTGYGDVKLWPGSSSLAADAQDECILHHVDTDALGMSDSRHMSIDKNNKLWVGDFAGGHHFVRVNGTTAAVETPVRTFDCGGYGGLIDKNGVIWSANGGANGLLRWNPDVPDSADNPRCIDIPVYGLAIDPNGFVWAGQLSGDAVRKVSPDGNTILGPFVHGSDSAQGLAADANGDIWVSSSLFCGSGCTIGHLKNDGTFVGNVDNPTGAGSTGVAIDAAGKVWSTNLNSNTATRIDPSAGPIGLDGVTHVGAVDLTVDFPATPCPSPPATVQNCTPFPYNYSDMTGAQLIGVTGQGSWTVTQDGGAAGTAWGMVTWNTEPQGNVPAGASIKVEARTADTEAGLGSVAFAEVANATPFTMVGRFIQVRATLTANSQNQSPVLSDIRIQTTGPPPPPPKATRTTYTGGSSVQYSDPVTLSGTLVDTSVTPNVGVAGKQLDFTLGTQTASASPTDASGNAATSLQVLQKPGSVTTVGTSFAGDSSYLPSSDSDPFSISREDCTLTYSGDTLVPPATMTTLAADMGETDISLGDRLNKTVTFTVVDAALNTQTFTATTDASGHASISVALPDGVYGISVSFAGDDFYLPCETAADTLVTVVAAGAKVTGGGWIAIGTGRTSFGFNAIPQAGGLFTGQFQMRSNNGKNRFHGNVVSSLSGSGNMATWSGTGSWNGEAGYTYTISVVDKGSSGSRKGDTISITITSPTNVIVFTTDGAQSIKGGNITVH